jgi:hypothetical protein
MGKHFFFHFSTARSPNSENQHFFFSCLPNCPIKMCLVTISPDTYCCCPDNTFGPVIMHIFWAFNGYWDKLVNLIMETNMLLHVQLHVQNVHNHGLKCVWASPKCFLEKIWTELRAASEKRNRGSFIQGTTVLKSPQNSESCFNVTLDVVRSQAQMITHLLVLGLGLNWATSSSIWW